MFGDLDIMFAKWGVLDPPSAVSHLYSGLVWSLLWSNLCRHSPWFFLSGVFWICLILYRELWLERHQTQLKTTTDISTKLLGLVGYLTAFI